MKNKLFVLLFIIGNIPLLSYSQDSQPPTLYNFYLEDGEVVFKQVYEFPSQNGGDMRTEILSFISKVPNVSNVREVGDEIVGDISNLKINYQKYGGTPMSTMVLLSEHMFGKLFIQIKDNKYRIIIKEIYFLSDNPNTVALHHKLDISPKTNFTTFVTKDKVTGFRTNKTVIEGVSYINNHLNDLFKYKRDDW